MDTNLLDFEICEGGMYPKKYRNNCCDECGKTIRNYQGMRREAEFIVLKDGTIYPSWEKFLETHDSVTNVKYEYATLRCNGCGDILARFRVHIGVML